MRPIQIWTLTVMSICLFVACTVLPKHEGDWAEGLAKGPVRTTSKNQINQCCTLCVCSLHPIIACTGLPKDEVVYPEGLAKGAREDDVDCPWLEVHQNDTWHIASSSCFVEVDLDAL
jgi:hypothetical protein